MIVESFIKGWFGYQNDRNDTVRPRNLLCEKCLVVAINAVMVTGIAKQALMVIIGIFGQV